MYKRPDLLFTDIDRLKKICAKFVRLQIIFSGKAHPQDREGKLLIQKIIGLGHKLNRHINIVYLNNYDIALAKLLTSGCDLPLAAPSKPPSWLCVRVCVCVCARACVRVRVCARARVCVSE